MMKIGIMSKGWNVPFKEAVLIAKEIGATGIQPFITTGAFSPVMTKEEREDAVRFLRDQQMELPAVCADFGSGFFAQDNNEAGVHRMISMIDMAVELGTNIVSTHIGHLSGDEKDSAYINICNTVRLVAKYAESRGVVLATETGRESAEVLKQFLERVGSKAMQVNMDPANLAMCVGVDPVQAVYTLGNHIVHTHVKDGIKTGETTYMETPLGEGAVPFAEYLRALKDIGYDGYLTIERGSGEDRIEEVRKAYAYLKEALKKIY